MNLTRQSFVLIGVSVFLLSSPTYASETEQQMNQEQAQLSQIYQQTQEYLQQIQIYQTQMIENKEKEENFEEAILKEKAIYQEKEYKIEKLQKKYNLLSKTDDEFLTTKQLEKKINQLIELKDKIRILDKKAEKYPELIENFEVSVAYYQKQRVVCESKQAILTAKIKDLSEQMNQLQAELKVLQQKKVAEDKQQAKEAEAKVTGFASPLETRLVVSSGFGGRPDPNGKAGTMHDGIDLSGSLNQNILAARAGQVVTTGSHPSAGNYIIVKHDNGFYSYYLHLNQILVKSGDNVALGQVIGKMGTTGNSTGVHLHFGLAKTPNWQGFVDPAYALRLK